MDRLKQHDVCKLVNISSVPKGEKIIGSRFVFKQKVDGWFKARLVLRGHVQKPGIGYRRSYEPVCRIGSIRTLVAHRQGRLRGASTGTWSEGLQDWGSHGLQASAQPLQLAQSPVLWYDTIDGVLVVIGFRPTQPDLFVYTHGSGVTLVILTLYVDDILITGKDPTLVEQKMKELKERFEMTDIGEVSRILGMEVTRDYDEGTLAITQTAYVDNILERFGMQDANAAHTQA